MRTAHVWSVEKVSDAIIVHCHLSDNRDFMLDGLEVVGNAGVLVTPMFRSYYWWPRSSR